MRYHRDFQYYAPRVLKIRTKTGEIHSFKLNEAQLHAHKLIEAQKTGTGRNVRAIILKGRQQGMSTYTEGRFYWLTSMNRGKQAYILTHEDKATSNLFTMAQRYHNHAPKWFQPKTARANSKELLFGELDSGYSVATAGTKNVGRSATVQYFHGSEVAFWPNASDHMASLFQGIPDEESEVILESTANGMNNLFHSLWTEAERGRNQYVPIFIPWFWQSEYRAKMTEEYEFEDDDEEYMNAYGIDLAQVAWRRNKIINDFEGDPAWFDQEYPATPDLAFRRVLGDTLIDPVDVAAARKPKDLDIEGAPKVMGVDPAEFGDDDTAIVFRQGRRAYGLRRKHGYSTMEVVGLVQQFLITDEQTTGVKVDRICVDSTGMGTGVADRLKELGYPVQRVIVGGRPKNEIEYRYTGDEIWGEMAEWIKDGPVEIPDDDVLQGDLTGRTFKRDSSRRLKLTPKEKMRDDGQPSPDSADALALTFAAHYSAGARDDRINHHRRPNTRVI